MLIASIFSHTNVPFDQNQLQVVSISLHETIKSAHLQFTRPDILQTRREATLMR